MPELRAKYGYEVAFGAMILFTTLTWVYLKRKKWF
jgi:Mg2+ and Co2+ transporter CorA